MKKVRKTSKTRPVFRVLRWGILMLTVISLVIVVWVDHIVREKFDGKKWAVPARVYARPLEMYVSAPLSQEGLEFELRRLNYSRVRSLTKPGQWLVQGDEYRIFTRGYDFADGAESSRKIRVWLNQHRIERLKADSGGDISLMRLEPLEIGGIYPNHPENRVIVSLSKVPPLLGETLIAVEDRNFVNHFGLSPKAILRAALANLKAGSVVQGGSTITQQLVKNFYLDSRQNLARKAIESVMALLLEFHYTKAEILETYINEVYLGQSGSQGVHGFALAAQHYFSKDLSELNSADIALLIGLVKGASYYNPWRHPERATSRRDLVLKVMYEGQLLSETEYHRARALPLGLVEPHKRQRQSYPAFLDLVKRQLLKDYKEEDLKTEGLSIFTTLDPKAQNQAELSMAETLGHLEKDYKLTNGSLEGGLAMLSLGNAEVLALVGGRNAQFSGFNRALDSRRPIGSLVKPAVYLAALEKGYSLSTLISDAPVAVKGPDASVWRPRNFSRQSHGTVPMFEALAMSYNQATARLGMNLGLESVASTLRDSGVEKPFTVVPSLLLGSIELSPLDVATMYHTFAAEGFYTKPRSIRSVQTPSGDTLTRYALESERRFKATSVYMLNYALSLVMQEGTGRRSGLDGMAKQRVTAGKTGTTNDQRDSWFSGYDGDRLMSVWLGRDDNGTTPLTGSSGALRVWADVMSHLPARSLTMAKPLELEYYWVDPQTGAMSGENCVGARRLPFEKSQRPQEKAHCEWRENPVLRWWKKVWQ